MRTLRKLTLLVILALFAVPAALLAEGKITCYTTWDDNYFYAAFQVDDPDITGTNTKPHSNPWEDDSVEIFLETDNKHASGRSKATFSMAVSAAGGSAFTVGTGDGPPERKNIMSFKYAVTTDGSIGNSEDLDVGYAVEMALPWFELGVNPPTPGTMMSFNVIVRMRGDSDRFVSLSDLVKTDADIQDASKWSNIVFTGPVFGAATLSLEKIVSARYVARMPLVDGQIRLNEYNKNTSFQFPLPIEAPKRSLHQLQKMLLTYYFYWYQGDPRKAAPFSHVRAQDGRSELTDQPVRSPGPWFSYDRIEWHKEELTDIKRAGIDIILPVYWGDPVNHAWFAAKGLDCMVEALRELKAEKKPYPLVGMFFDTTAMALAYGAKPDLRNEEVKRTFYGMIHDFFDRVPEEFRAQVQMGDERAARPCCIIDLYTSGYFSDLDSSFVAYACERFAKDFDANILWMGARDFKDKVPALDAYCSYGAGLGFGYDDSAKIRIAAVGAGYDDSAVLGRETPIRPRDAGDTYRSDWSKALEKRPNWIMLDGWNELHEGSEVCGSREYGFTFVDATAVQSLKFRGAKDYGAKYLWHNLPRTAMAGRFYQADILIQNDGTRPWLASEGYALGYRWYKDGSLAAETGVKRPIQEDILPGHAGKITIGVATVKEGGEQLPEGDYEVRFEMVRLADNKWFSSFGVEGFSVPVHVGKPEHEQARYLTIDGPVMLRTAMDYTYRVRVRNDGAETWPAAAMALGCRLYRVSNYVHGGPPDSEQEVPVIPTRVSLPKDLAPGEAAEVEVKVNLKDADGKPIPVWRQSDPWSYQLRFDLWDGKRWMSEAGFTAGRQTVDVFDSDYGANIIACDVPDVLDAGKAYQVKLVVRNGGPDTWQPGRHSFGYHWYYLDGIEAVWDGEKTPIKAQIKPGEPAAVIAKLTAPPYDGRYILAWDFADKDRWASTSEISRGKDLLVKEVTVQNGKLVLVDLSKLFDTVASSPDRNRSSGDFDGAGRSFPAEFMPPDVGLGKPNDVYPCGYLWKAERSGMECLRRISFRYAPKAAGDKNAIVCAGQTVSVPKARYAVLHVLAAATQADQEAEFGLRYDTSVEPAKITISSWTDEPAHGEDAAFVGLHRHSASGDERSHKCFLFHYAIPVDPNRPLASVVLPKNDKVRVLAITVEAA